MKRAEPRTQPDDIAEDDAEILGRDNDGGETRTPCPRVRRLRTVRDVTWELGTIYSLARRGRMTWADAARAAYVLRTCGDLLVASDVEARLEAIEQRGGGQ